VNATSQLNIPYNGPEAIASTNMGKITNMDVLYVKEGSYISRRMKWGVGAGLGWMV